MLLAVSEEAQGQAIPAASRHKSTPAWMPTTKLRFPHGRSCRLYASPYVATTSAGASPCETSLLGFSQLRVGARCLAVRPNRPLSTSVCALDQGPGSQRDCRLLLLPSLRHFPLFTRHQADASGLRKVHFVSSMTRHQDGGDDGTLTLGCSPF